MVCGRNISIIGIWKRLIEIRLLKKFYICIIRKLNFIWKIMGYLLK